MATVEKLDLGPARLSDAARIAEMSRRWIEHRLTWRYTPDSIAGRIRASETEVVVARGFYVTVAIAVLAVVATTQLTTDVRHETASGMPAAQTAA